MPETPERAGLRSLTSANSENGVPDTIETAGADPHRDVSSEFSEKRRSPKWKRSGWTVVLID
ncbi:hypothetical protein ABTH30_22545, partial [Acinetobacter baumannii]